MPQRIFEKTKTLRLDQFFESNRNRVKCQADRNRLNFEVIPIRSSDKYIKIKKKLT